MTQIDVEADELDTVRLVLDHLASRRSGSGLSEADDRRYHQLALRERELLTEDGPVSV